METLLVASAAILAVSGIFVVLGLGGGILFVPILHWVGYDLQSVAIPLGLLLNGSNTLLALLPYGRAGLVDWRGGLPMALAAAVTAPLGALAQPRLDADWVLALFAAAVSVAAYRALRGVLSRRRAGAAATARPSGSGPARRLAVGAAVGFVGGLLGIGAGFVVAPVLMAMGYAPRQMAATTALVVTVCSFAGFAGYLPQMDLPWPMAGAGLAAVVVGSQLGSRLMIRGAKPAWIAWGYAVLLAAIAGRLAWEATGLLGG